MNISRRVRFAAATTTVLTGVLATGGVFAAQAQAMPKAAQAQAMPKAPQMPEITTYSYNRNQGYVPIQSWNCADTSHFGIINPIIAVGNACSTRVWLHGRSLNENYCVSPFTFNQFNNRFTVRDIQVTPVTANC